MPGLLYEWISIARNYSERRVDVGPPSQETIDGANMANMALITRSHPVSIHTTKQSCFIDGNNR